MFSRYQQFLAFRMKPEKTETPGRRTARQKAPLSQPKGDSAAGRGPATRTTPKPKTSPKLKLPPALKKDKELVEVTQSTPPKPTSSKMKLSVSNSKISIADETQPSTLDLLNISSSSDSQSNDTLDKLSEIGSDELEDTVPTISIPDDIRTEAGTNWRLKEAILNSFHYGKETIKAHEFARSDSDLKTADIVCSDEHSLDSKKYRVKIHLGNYLSSYLTEFFLSFLVFFSQKIYCHKINFKLIIESGYEVLPITQLQYLENENSKPFWGRLKS